MTVSSKEKDFQNAIEKTLLDGDYIKREPANFDKKLFLDSELFVKFVKDTQEESWNKLIEDFTEEEILKKLVSEIENSSLINVLRKGFSIYDVQIECAVFKPVHTKNQEHQKQYEKNILSVISEAQYDNEGHELDLLLCLNGFPIATVELKNPSTDQTYKDAIRQYKEDRDPRNPLLAFKRGALVHFAVDPFDVYMTTKLEGDKTKFLPFNKGRKEASGNPNNPNGYRTSYLWEQIWQKEIWLEIIGNFIDHQIKERKSPAEPEEKLIFPRYHQLDAVLKLAETTKQNGPGKNYLIEHSTGSGKSNTIAWLAYKLFSLHDKNDNPVFDGVLILSDRVVIIDQLANTVKQFQKTEGVVEKPEKSSILAEKLETQNQILISTQQKFPHVLEKISQIKGRNFAIIIDEAHSSQTGESAKTVKQVLTNLDKEAEEESKAEDSQKDIIDLIKDDIDARQPSENLSYYAFTATPKKKTLRLFGKEVSEDLYIPFHKYSMRQAIEEGFILDVLKNYSTYDRQFKLVQTASEDKIVEGKAATRAVMNYVDTHHDNLSNKAEIIVEHFREHTLEKIGGNAKAMVVASSRNQARLYKQEIDAYIKSKNYEEINTLVAFSGSLKDETGNIYTENSINKTRSDQEISDKFNTKKFNILIVAEKFQTGFDQPLLHTMYVDKKLKGIKIVQTLSRLNRTADGKTETFVLDFHNTVEEIRDGFAKYYQGATLIDKTTPHFIFKLFNEIMSLDIIQQNDLDEFAEIFFKPSSKHEIHDQGMLYSKVNGIIERFGDADEKDQDRLKILLIKYVESYSFLSFVLRYNDTNLEKLFVVVKFLRNGNLLRGIGFAEPNLTGDMSLQYYRLEKTHEGDISLDNSKKSMKLTESTGTVKTPDVMTTLSNIIEAINQKFGADIRVSDAERIVILKWLEDLLKDPELRLIAENNKSKDDFMRQFEARLKQKMRQSPEENQNLVEKIYGADDLLKTIITLAGDPYHKMAQTNTLPPIRPCNPYENRLQFGNRIHDCENSVKWIDLYLNKDGIEFLLQRKSESVKEIKILTSLPGNEREINEKLHEYLVLVTKELEQKGISFEMRVITKKDDVKKSPHDRFLIGSNVVYVVPSYTTMVAGRYSEFKKTEFVPPFDDSWNSESSFDIVKDWKKINGLKVKCDECGKEFVPPFTPDGVRPVYCRDCLQNHRN